MRDDTVRAVKKRIKDTVGLTASRHRVWRNNSLTISYMEDRIKIKFWLCNGNIVIRINDVKASDDPRLADLLYKSSLREDILVVEDLVGWVVATFCSVARQIQRQDRARILS